MRIVKIIMLSGGYDSTGLLFWALGHKEWTVIAHHVELVNSEKRNTLESDAVNKIREYLCNKLIRYEYSSTKFENMDPIHFGKDIVNVGFIAAIVAQSAFIKYSRLDCIPPDVEVFTGGTLEDYCDEQMENMDGIGIKTKVFETMFFGFDVPDAQTPKISIPFKNVPKRDVVKYIPAELLQYIWTCRIPTRKNGNFVECGECVACYRKKKMDEAA